MNYDIDAMRKCLQDAAKRDPRPDTAKKAVAALHPELIVLRKQRSWKEIAAELGDLWDGTPDKLRQLHVKDVRSRADNSLDAVPSAPKQRRVKSKVFTTAPVRCPGGGAESHTGSDKASLMLSARDIAPDGAAVAVTPGGQSNLGPFAVQRDIFGDEADA